MVGPNGSGKSNVIDAMLFVFGKRAKQVKFCYLFFDSFDVFLGLLFLRSCAVSNRLHTFLSGFSLLQFTAFLMPSDCLGNFLLCYKPWKLHPYSWCCEPYKELVFLC